MVFSFDILILVSSLNVIVLFVTVAYSLYYLTCFRSILLFKSDAQNKEEADLAEADVVVLSENLASVPLLNEVDCDLEAENSSRFS